VNNEKSTQKTEEFGVRHGQTNKQQNDTESNCPSPSSLQHELCFGNTVEDVLVQDMRWIAIAIYGLLAGL
jgi:hypothetical protein